jgi:hypothetical protein
MVTCGIEVPHTLGVEVVHGMVVDSLRCGVVVGHQLRQTEKLVYLNIKDISTLFVK